MFTPTEITGRFALKLIVGHITFTELTHTPLHVQFNALSQKRVSRKKFVTHKINATADGCYSNIVFNLQFQRINLSGYFLQPSMCSRFVRGYKKNIIHVTEIVRYMRHFLCPMINRC